MNKKLAKAKSLVSNMMSHRTAREGRWRELKDWICPTRGIFDGTDAGIEDKQKLVSFTHAASAAVLRGASGMTSGMTPRNAAWFKPDFANPRLSELSGARAWLDNVANRMRDCLSDGGFYQAIQAFNIDLLAFGCALLYPEKEDDAILRFEACQIGTFYVETMRNGLLSAVARRLSFTVEELAGEFGEENISDAARSKLKTNPWEQVKVWHLVRNDGDGRKPVTSVFYEETASDKFLRQSGYFEMPYFFTVWHESETPYGTGPGDEALADSMQMDELERRKLEGLAKLTEPPMQVNNKLKDWIDLSPGGLNFIDRDTLVRPILDLAPYAHAFPYLREEIATVHQRLEQTLYASIFSSIPLDQRPRDMSATEFLERKREALQQLGPVISAYEPNVLTPLLYRVLQTLDRRGLMPTPPQELAGPGLLMKMDLISPMANALRQTSAETTRALFQDVAQMAQAAQNPEVLDKLDLDQMVDELAGGLGAPGSVVRADADVVKMREQRAQQQMEQQQMQLKAQAAQTGEAESRAVNQQAQAARTLRELAGAENGGQ